MRLVILDNSDEVADWSARYIIKRIRDFNPGPDRFFVLGLPTGERLDAFHRRSSLGVLTCPLRARGISTGLTAREPDGSLADDGTLVLIPTDCANTYEEQLTVPSANPRN